MTQILLRPLISTAGAEIPHSSNDKNDASRPVISMAGAKIPYSSNDKNDAPNLVISTEAERSGEISCPMVQGAWRQEFSRLRVSRAPSLPMPPGSSARDDQWACILPSENRYGKKGCEEMICMSSRSFLVGEIPWGCEVMAHHESFRSIPSHPCLWSINLCKNKVLDRKKAFSYNKEKG